MNGAGKRLSAERARLPGTSKLIDCTRFAELWALSCDPLRSLSAHIQHTEHCKCLKDKADRRNPSSGPRRMCEATQRPTAQQAIGSTRAARKELPALLGREGEWAFVVRDHGAQRLARQGQPVEILWQRDVQLVRGLLVGKPVNDNKRQRNTKVVR